MKNFFKPEDFPGKKDFGLPLDIREQCAELANKKLNALIESWPVVCGSCDDAGDLWYGTADSTTDTHKARLAFIEEIVKEPCKHEPTEYDVHWKNVICIKCGVELQATWSEKK